MQQEREILLQCVLTEQNNNNNTNNVLEYYYSTSYEISNASRSYGMLYPRYNENKFHEFMSLPKQLLT